MDYFPPTFKVVAGVGSFLQVDAKKSRRLIRSGLLAGLDPISWTRSESRKSAAVPSVRGRSPRLQDGASLDIDGVAIDVEPGLRGHLDHFEIAAQQRLQHTSGCTPRAWSRSRFPSPPTTRGLLATTYSASEGGPADASNRGTTSIDPRYPGSPSEPGETRSVHRRDRSAGRADSCSRLGAAEAGLQARTLARPSPTRCPSAGRIRSRSPTSSHSASWCRRGA